MSGVALQAAIVSALQGIITAFDAPPVRAAVPYVVIEDAVLAR